MNPVFLLLGGFVLLASCSPVVAAKHPDSPSDGTALLRLSQTAKRTAAFDVDLAVVAVQSGAKESEQIEATTTLSLQPESVCITVDIDATRPGSTEGQPPASKAKDSEDVCFLARADTLYELHGVEVEGGGVDLWVSEALTYAAVAPSSGPNHSGD